MLTLEEGTFLVKTARKAFFTYLDQKRSLTVLEPHSSKLEQKTGAYVRVGTFAEQGRNEEDVILDFTGYPIPLKSLYQSVVDASTAIAARSLQHPSSINDILFEVTALSTPHQLQTIDAVRIASEIKLGRDALMIGTPELKKAIILPQTAIKTCRSEVELLGECCTAAGLMADAWLTSAEIGVYRFQTQIFRETGSVKEVLEISLAP